MTDKNILDFGYGLDSKLSTDRQSCQSSYQQSEDYERNALIKQQQREQILDFMLANHPSELHPRYLGLPGKYWIFERMLYHENPKSFITGIEKDYQIYKQGARYMPGERWKQRQVYPWGRDKRLEDVHGRTPRMSAIEISEASRSYLICGELQSLTDQKIINKGRARAFYKKQLINRTAIWYDFTSSFDINSYITIWNIQNIRDFNRDTIICLTLQYGRDQLFNGPGEEARVGIVEKALPGFKCSQVWTYKGMNKVPMINICGILEKGGQN